MAFEITSITAHQLLKDAGVHPASVVVDVVVAAADDDHTLPCITGPSTAGYAMARAMAAAAALGVKVRPLRLVELNGGGLALEIALNGAGSDWTVGHGNGWRSRTARHRVKVASDGGKLLVHSHVLECRMGADRRLYGVISDYTPSNVDHVHVGYDGGAACYGVEAVDADDDASAKFADAVNGDHDHPFWTLLETPIGTSAIDALARALEIDAASQELRWTRPEDAVGPRVLVVPHLTHRDGRCEWRVSGTIAGLRHEAIVAIAGAMRSLPDFI